MFIKIPDSVIEIDEGAFSGSYLEYIEIPKTVKKIGAHAFYYCDNLVNIIVDKDNPYYASYDGALYDKKLTTLYAYPTITSKYVSFPKTLKTIKINAIAANYCATELIIHEHLETIETHNVVRFHQLKKISVDAKNLHFKVVDNVYLVTI